jgi:hypothetical protein
VNQIDHAAEQFFATSCRARMNQYEQRLFDHYKKRADQYEAQQLKDYLLNEKRAAFFNPDRKRAS